MTTAYRMSAEIADWLNAHAGKRSASTPSTSWASVPPAVPVREPGGRIDPGSSWPTSCATRWPNVVTITPRRHVEATRAWSTTHVVVDTAGMDPAELYLCGLRAADELVVLR